MDGTGESAVRSFRLPQPTRSMVAAVPYWTGLVAVVGLGVLVVMATGPADGTTVLLLLVAAVIWAIAAGVVFRTWSRVVKEVRIDRSNTIVLVDVIGRRTAITPEAVSSIREQQFIPHPGYTRIAVDDDVHYLGPFDDKHILMEHLTEEGPRGSDAST